MIDWKPVPTWQPPTGDALIAIAERANKLADDREQACRRYYGTDRAAELAAHDVVSCALTNVVNPVALSSRYAALASLVSDLFRGDVNLPSLAEAQRDMMPAPAALAELAQSITTIVAVCEMTGRDLRDAGRRVVNGLRRYAELLTENKINT